MSWVEGPFRAFWTLALRLSFVSKKVRYALAKCYLCFVFSSWWRRRRPWRPPGRYGASTHPVAAFSGFAWSHQNAPSSDVTRDVLPRRHGRRICRQKCYILFFRRLESKLVFILFLYQFIDLDKSLRPPPPPTPFPPRICAWSGVSIKSAPREGTEAHHGGVVCVLWLCCRKKKKPTIPT